jgi:hypothetical protein
MAARAENGGVGQDRLYGSGILSMFGLRSVAGLAVDPGVFARRLNRKDIDVAGLTGFVAGVDDRQCCDLGDGIGAIVAVLTEALRDKPGA